jgi:hypothetical protein
MKKLMLMLLIAACSSGNKVQETALTDFKNYVNSVLEKNKIEKYITDTFYQEVPTDFNDPTKTTIDTTVTLVMNGDSCIYHYSPSNYLLKEEFSKYVNLTDSLLKGANESTLKEYAKYKTAIDTLYSFKYEKN